MMPDKLGEQFGLVIEVVRQRTLRHARLHGDRPRSQRIRPTTHKHPSSSLNQSPSSFIAIHLSGHHASVPWIEATAVIELTPQAAPITPEGWALGEDPARLDAADVRSNSINGNSLRNVSFEPLPVWINQVRRHAQAVLFGAHFRRRMAHRQLIMWHTRHAYAEAPRPDC